MKSNTTRPELAPNRPQYVQFSKKVTIAVTALWGVFRFLTLAVIVFRPEVATALTTFQQGMDDVMIVAIGFYCGNSVAEKGIIGYFGAKRKASYSSGGYYYNDDAEDGEGLG